MGKGSENPRPWLFMEDEALLRQCRREAMRGTGPGGQKRNKTSSAIRLTHEPTGISIRAEESRSQKQNLGYALQRLRLAIALQIRVDPVPLQLSTLLPKRPADVAGVLDSLAAHGYVLSDAIASLHCTTGALSAFLCANEDVLSEVNRQRATLRLKPLRRNV